MTSRASRIAVLLALPVLLAPMAARADVTKDQCIDANSRAQTLRREGKLQATRAALKILRRRRLPGDRSRRLLAAAR